MCFGCRFWQINSNFICGGKGARVEKGVMSDSKLEGPLAPLVRRDPYEVLSVARDASDQEIKTAYRKLALK